jgi:DNA topoisomerase-2
VKLAQNFPGSNNCNLLEPKGEFGNRFEQDAGASRYIFIVKSEWMEKLFNPADFKLYEY